MKKHIRWPKLLMVLLIVCLCFTGLALAQNYYIWHDDGSYTYGQIHRDGSIYEWHSDGSSSYGRINPDTGTLYIWRDNNNYSHGRLIPWQHRRGY